MLRRYPLAKARRQTTWQAPYKIWMMLKQTVLLPWILRQLGRIRTQAIPKRWVRHDAEFREKELSVGFQRLHTLEWSETVKQMLTYQISTRNWHDKGSNDPLTTTAHNSGDSNLKQFVAQHLEKASAIFARPSPSAPLCGQQRQLPPQAIYLR